MTSNCAPSVRTCTPCDTGQCKYGTIPAENFPTLGSLVDPSTRALQIGNPWLLARSGAVEKRSILTGGVWKGMAEIHSTPFLLDTETGAHACTRVPSTRLRYGAVSYWIWFTVMDFEAQFLSVASLGREVMVHEGTRTSPDSGCSGSHFVTRSNYQAS